MVWIKLRSERKKPSLSASKIATKDTSGMSKPSRKRLIPTSTSKVPILRSRIISTRSTVSIRSEEHTSELQSRGHLVYRLLLEKKKDKQETNTTTHQNRLQ